ncbi:MAG: RDD family protein [Proteobacteria bacterium]|nr:MAG: RDD family protein [Pseudomonadota bacterium]
MPQASFARRAVAYFTDLFVIYALAVVTLIGCVGLYGQIKFGGDAELMKALAQAKSTRTFTFWAHAAIYLSYFTITQWYAGRTAGKALWGIRAALKSGGEMSLAQSFGRTLGYVVSGQLTLGVGFLLPLLRKDGRALHDLLSGTEVYRVLSTAPALSATPNLEPAKAAETSDLDTAA